METPRPAKLADVHEFKIHYEPGDMPMGIWEILDSKGAVSLHSQFAQELNGKKKDEDVSTVVKTYEERFHDLGIGLYFISHACECEQISTSGGKYYNFEMKTYQRRWLEYADLDDVGRDYKPSTA